MGLKVVLFHPSFELNEVDTVALDFEHLSRVPLAVFGPERLHAVVVFEI